MINLNLQLQKQSTHANEKESEIAPVESEFISIFEGFKLNEKAYNDINRREAISNFQTKELIQKVLKSIQSGLLGGW